jgi:hypothetical protein
VHSSAFTSCTRVPCYCRPGCVSRGNSLRNALAPRGDGLHPAVYLHIADALPSLNDFSDGSQSPLRRIRLLGHDRTCQSQVPGIAASLRLCPGHWIAATSAQLCAG